MRHSVFKLTVLFAVLLLVPVSAQAAWLAHGTVSDFNDYGNGVKVLLANDTGTLHNPAGCTGTTSANRYIYPDPTFTADQRDNLNRIILAAALAGRPLGVRVHDSRCTGAGTSGFRVYESVGMSF